MRKTLVLLVLIVLSGCAQSLRGELYYFAAPSVLPNVETEMKTPGFWISRLDEPDKELMTSAEIQFFNEDMVRSKLREDIAKFKGPVSGRDLRQSVKNEIRELARRGYFRSNGQKALLKFFDGIEKTLGLENMHNDLLPVAFAVVVRNTDQRVLPTREKLTEKPLDIDFDELQNNALDINTPVVILWQTLDKTWSLVKAPSSSGWVWTQNLALCSQEDIQNMKSSVPAVVTEARADIFLDKELKKFYGFARMGASFPIKGFLGDEVVEIALASADKNGELILGSGYVRARDVHRGYLPYTARSVIQQAFEMLNTPYGWGGANGEQDCSQFLQEVFATMGFEIPRNSYAQAKIGIPLCDFSNNEDKTARLSQIKMKAQPGLSLLYMKGHIMLYLGEINFVPYAIHDTWAYRKSIHLKETPLLINKVTVSDLSLGEGTTKGSLLNRLKSIRILVLDKERLARSKDQIKDRRYNFIN